MCEGFWCLVLPFAKIHLAIWMFAVCTHGFSHKKSHLYLIFLFIGSYCLRAFDSMLCPTNIRFLLLAFNLCLFLSGTCAYAKQSDFEICYLGLLSWPIFSSNITTNYLCGTCIQQKHCCLNCVNPKLIIETASFHHPYGHFQFRMILPFFYTILLWCVCNEGLPSNSMLVTKITLDSYC